MKGNEDRPCCSATHRAETGPVLPGRSRLACGKVGEGTLGKPSIVGPQGLDLLQGWCPFAPVCSSARKQEAPWQHGAGPCLTRVGLTLP